eukprot:Selendium_serpulae@DN6303_c0_g2_i1.p4
MIFTSQTICGATLALARRSFGTQPLLARPNAALSPLAAQRVAASCFASSSAPRRRAKLAMVGAGNIGATLSLIAAQRHLGDTVLFDVAKGVPHGKALDLNQAMPCLSVDAQHS